MAELCLEEVRMNCYCLFCETQKGLAVASAAAQLFSCRAIYPMQVQHTWVHGKMTDRVNPLLPGYVFLYSEEKLDISKSRAVSGVIRCLSEGGAQYELHGGDEAFALMLLSKNGVIGKTKVYQEGQTIRICKGAFEGVKARILKVQRRNSRMLVELPFTHQTVKTWVEYEMVEDETAE